MTVISYIFIYITEDMVTFRYVCFGSFHYIMATHTCTFPPAQRSFDSTRSTKAKGTIDRPWQ